MSVKPQRRLGTIFWLATAIVAVGFLAYKTVRDESAAQAFRDSIRHINWGWAIPAILLYSLAQPLLAPRWLILLRVQEVMVSLYQAVKLTYLGLFYNNVMPGAVGGDLLKGWYITHHSQKHLRVEAAVTVFVDRLMGLIGMILVGAIASLFVGPDLKFHTIEIRWLIWGILGGLVVAAIIFLSRRIRRSLFLNRLLERLPFSGTLHKIDQAIRLYRSHPKTVAAALVLTVCIQGMAIVAIWMLARALGFEKVSFVQCLIIVPIVWLVGAVVPVPAGLGVIEGSIIGLFRYAINPADPQGAMGEAAALALMFRVLMIYVASLPGALVPLFGGHMPKRSEMQRELQADESQSRSG